MKCNHCKGLCIKKGKNFKGVQKYQCKNCNKYQREEYIRCGFEGGVAGKVKLLLKESCGIRSISRILKISTTTVILIIKQEVDKLRKPVIVFNKEYEADKLKTYVHKKKNEQWVIYAIDKRTRQVVDFRVGRRNKRNLKRVIDTLLLSGAKRICTDGLAIYKSLIPKNIHKTVPHNTNYKERKNLNLRTHLKRLTRKTICFSKSIEMLESCLQIYLWREA